VLETRASNAIRRATPHGVQAKTALSNDVTAITFCGVRMWDHACVQPEGDAMERFRKILIASRILMLAGLAVTTPAAAATFDGEWNVQIASKNAACGSGATVSIGINNGRVASTNGLMSASGRVANAGTIRVTLTSGIKRAVGSGQLTATSGSGTWRGALCSGTWTAQRI
jgi:hypothetical protein